MDNDWEDQTFSALEEPTTSKWQQLLENIAYLKEVIESGGWSPFSSNSLYSTAPVYASATTFTIAGDWTSVLQKGDKIKLTQTTVKYFVVKSVSYSAPNTTVTVYGSTDYSVADATIASPYYSKANNPQGFPDMMTEVGVYLSGNQSIAAGATDDIEFDTEDFDNLGEFNTTTHVLTVKNEGKYLVNVLATMDDVDNAKDTRLQLYTSSGVFGTIVSSGADDQDLSSNISQVVSLSAGGTLKAQFNNGDADSNVLISGGKRTYMSIIRLPINI